MQRFQFKRAVGPQHTSERQAARLNARFRNGRPSDNVSEIGLIFKQFDGFELPGRPWEACVGACRSPWQRQSAVIPGRVSAMIAYQGLRSRSDRVAISLPFPDRGGVGAPMPLPKQFRRALSLLCSHPRSASQLGRRIRLPLRLRWRHQHLGRRAPPRLQRRAV